MMSKEKKELTKEEREKRKKDLIKLIKKLRDNKYEQVEKENCT